MKGSYYIQLVFGEGLHNIDYYIFVYAIDYMS